MRHTAAAVDKGFGLGGVRLHVGVALILSYASSCFPCRTDPMPRPITDSEDAGVDGGVCGYAIERPRSGQRAVDVLKGSIVSRRRIVETN